MNLAVIGCGHWGMRWIDIFESIGATIKVCCDIDERALERAGKSAPHSTLTKNYKTILDREDIEAAYIATPPSTHYEIASDCLLAGKHILVEKPITADYKHAWQLTKLAERRDRTLMVGNTYLYNEAIQTIKYLANSHAIGKLRYMRLCMTDSLDMWVGKNIRDYADVIWDLSPHPISIASYIIGEWPSRVIALSGTPSSEFGGSRDVVSTSLCFPGGATAILYLDWLDHIRDRRIVLIGAEGAMWCEDLSNKESLTLHIRRFSFSRAVIQLYPMESCEIDVRNTLVNEARHFLSCASNSRVPISDGANGAMIVAIIESIHESIAQGKACEVIRSTEQA